MRRITLVAITALIVSMTMVSTIPVSNAAHLTPEEDVLLVRVLLDSSYRTVYFKVSFFVDKNIDPQWYSELSGLLSSITSAERRQEVHKAIQESLNRFINEQSTESDVVTRAIETYLSATNLVRYEKFGSDKMQVDIAFKLEDGMGKRLLGPHFFDLLYLTLNVDSVATVAGREINPAELLLLDTTDLQDLPPSEVTEIGKRPAYIFTTDREVVQADFGREVSEIKVIVILPQDTVYHFIEDNKIVAYTYEDLSLMLILPIFAVLLALTVIFSHLGRKSTAKA
jgi:hypothetical protein